MGIMGFGDLNKDAGLKVLNTFLEDKSYVDGYVPSQADVVVFKAMSGSPDEKFVHALRWFLHMTKRTPQNRKESRLRELLRTMRGRPGRRRLQQNLQFFWTSNPGMTRPTWLRWNQT